MLEASVDHQSWGRLIAGEGRNELCLFLVRVKRTGNVQAQELAGMQFEGWQTNLSDLTPRTGKQGGSRHCQILSLTTRASGEKHPTCAAPVEAALRAVCM